MIAKVGNSVRIYLSLLSKHPPEPILDCLIILNMPLGPIFPQLFIPSAKNIICADGGANRLFDSPFRDTPNLKAITGDLDSLKPDVKKHYQSRNIPIVKDGDQDTNDFQKAILLALKKDYISIACLGVLGGRFDQEFCNLSSMQKFGTQYKDPHFIGLGEGSLTYLVKSNIKTTMVLNQHCIKNQVGLICLGQAKVETEGYKWNLGEKYGLPCLKWGELVSSSNEATGDEVTIEASAPVFASFQFAPAGKM